MYIFKNFYLFQAITVPKSHISKHVLIQKYWYEHHYTLPKSVTNNYAYATDFRASTIPYTDQMLNIPSRRMPASC